MNILIRLVLAAMLLLSLFVANVVAAPSPNGCSHAAGNGGPHGQPPGHTISGRCGY